MAVMTRVQDDEWWGRRFIRTTLPQRTDTWRVVGEVTAAAQLANLDRKGKGILQ